MTLRLLALLLLLVLPAAALGETPGGVWRVQEVVLGPEATMTRDQAEQWLDKPARITQTAISFEGRSCRVTPEITRVQLGVFLASRQTTPSELGVEDGLADLVDTGCDIPGFQTMLALPDGRFVALYQGAYIFLDKGTAPAGSMQAISEPEAGFSLELPDTVRILAPWGEPESGLGFWYETALLEELGPGSYPFDQSIALRDRAALAAASLGEEASGFLPPKALPGSQQLLELPKPARPALGPAWGKTWAVLRPDKCSVSFTLVATLYHQGRVVQFGLAAAPQTVIQENPGYFAATNCQEAPHWSDEQAQAAFWSMLRNDRATGLAALWSTTFAAMLDSLELSRPVAPSFLGSSHEGCRALGPEVFASRLPGAVLVPEQTFSLELPDTAGAQTLPQGLCLVTLQQGDTQLQALTAGDRLLQVLAPPDGGSLVTRALGVDDLNADGLPDVVVVASRDADSPAARPDNRIHFSRPDAPKAAGLQWLLSPSYSEAIRTMPTVADAIQTVRAMRAALLDYVGRGLQTAGSVEEQFGSLIFVPESMPEVAPDLEPRPLRCTIFDPDGQPDELRETGRRVWLDARVLEAEDALPPLTLLLQVLDHKPLEVAPQFDFTFQGPEQPVPAELPDQDQEAAPAAPPEPN